MLYLLPYLDDDFEKEIRRRSFEKANETNMGQLLEQEKI